MSDNHESWQGAASEHAGRERRQGRFFPWVRESGLVRSAEERWIGGVCGGLGRYLGWSPLLVRALMIGAAFVAGIGVVFYALAWFLLPDERDGRILCEELLDGHWDWSCLGVLLGLVCMIFWPPVWLFGLAAGAFALWLVIEQAGRRNLRYAVAQWANPSSRPQPASAPRQSAPFVQPQPAPSTRPEATGGMPAGEVPAGAPTGAAPVSSAAVPPMMTSPYRAPQPAPKPRVARRKPAGPLLVLIVTGLIFLSFACMLFSWADTRADLETLLGGGMIWIGGVCVAIGLIIVILGCIGRRTGGLHPFVWLAAFLAVTLAFGGLAYSVMFQRMMRTRTEYAYADGSGMDPDIQVHGFDAIGSDKATMQRLEDGLWMEGDNINDVLHIDLSDYAEDNGSHEVTLNDGTTATSSCPVGTIRVMPYRTSVVITIPDGCSWQLTGDSFWYDGNDSFGSLWAAATSPWNMVGIYLPSTVNGQWLGATTTSAPWLDADYDGEPLYWPFDQGNPKAVASPELRIDVDAAVMGQVVVQYDYQNTLPTYQEWADKTTEDDHE
ncbi:PspC domain-containing protein [Bifidobacterium pullorum]|uniref:PspC domain-containing protein n=1 Tax=Bifidobacterium pullorum subsp. gallinarum TaxID=78344 RepID=A0A921IW11_9BIFI|nr:PspC domain-containing protein [Bifidobacterium pullorum]HJG40964.1 PspC domain-containing protein [Bifidobacterium pullorum subsp. gallinarum]